MSNANKARKKATQHNERLLDNAYHRVKQLIDAAVERGEFSITDTSGDYNGVLGLVEKLTSEGFKAEASNSYQGPYFSINW